MYSLGRYFVENDNFASGCFGRILLAKDESSREVVIKMIPKEGSNPTEVKREIAAGGLLNHSHIGRFIETFENKLNYFLVFERIVGRDLYSTIEKRQFVPFDDQRAKSIFKQILKAVRYCHSKGVIHRDIKLENILIDPKGKVTLIDFGLCDLITQPGQDSEKFCGSMDYVAPEVIARPSYNGKQADCFSLGVVLFTLIFAEFPFVSGDRVNAIRNARSQPNPNFSDAKMKKFMVDPLAKDLICKMLKSTVNDRITLDEVKNHPWMLKKKPSQC